MGNIDLNKTDLAAIAVHEKKSKEGKKLTGNQQKAYDKAIDKRDNPQLLQTAKSFLEDWHKGKLYKSRKEFTSKYTDKGNRTEEDAVRFLVKSLDLGFAEKNSQRFYNEWAHGEPDVLLVDEVIDIKSSWDEYTFVLYDDTYNTDYYYQLQGYMWLTGKKKARLCFCLMNMDEENLNRLTNLAMYKDKNQDKTKEEVYTEIEKRYSFEHLPVHLRLKIFEFEYDPQVVEEIKRRVLMARDYLKTLDAKVEQNRLKLAA